MSGHEGHILDGAIPPEANPALYGHDEALKFLSTAYRSGKSHHALLIEGPEGIGKATLAFRFANHVLANPVAHQAPLEIGPPDLNSLEYRQIVAGASHSLIHLTRPEDAKTGKLRTEITVEEVRRLGRFFGQTSGNDNWRIVIVDPADDMNRNAANAILKMLEEPPKRAMFLVISHAPGKLLPTIRSRCLPIRLKPLVEADLEAALKNLGFEIEPAMREALLREAGGSVSEALKLVNYGGLEMLMALHEAASTGGPSARKAMHKIADALSARDNDTLFSFFSQAVLHRMEVAARQNALSGALANSDRISARVSELRQKLTVSAAYNLDKKQTALSMIETYCESV
ncbi:DNA polymerase III subunit delta' [Rhizobium sp. L1K21]|uniref:DNA polymerase III subunit delta' n=1 Tax=Rhizobium sp. L1K21 TaxID=2954933 RepID=UPI0020933AAD|nr:DNA polymerase III subunit delta' [Rhizobium sp. L1K21]